MEIDGLILKFLDFYFSLVSENSPVNGHTKVLGVTLLAIHLHLMESLLGDIVLVPLFHFSPDIEHEHRLVIFVPGVFHSGNIEAWDC